MFGMIHRPSGIDGRVGQALSQLGVRYEIDTDGDYKFGFALGDDRSQLCFIRSQTYSFAGVELRDIFSMALHSVGLFDARTANLLLEQNEQLKVGAWGILKDFKDNYLAVFTAKVAADLSGEALQGVIHAVVTTADEMEKRLGGRDDF